MTEAGNNENTRIAVASALRYAFQNKDLCTAALTHRSFLNEHPEAPADNQRLEFLGDAVFNLVVAEEIMRRLPSAPEGELTSRRACLVNELCLADTASKIDLGQALRLGRGEEATFGRVRPSMLADALEALVGAVYLDGGIEAARRVVLGLLEEKIDAAVSSDPPADVKTGLQELLQAENAGPPVYRVVREDGPDHEKTFEVEIEAGGSILGVGRGRSKKEAEKNAARAALARAKEKT